MWKRLFLSCKRPLPNFIYGPPQMLIFLSFQSAEKLRWQMTEATETMSWRNQLWHQEQEVPCSYQNLFLYFPRGTVWVCCQMKSSRASLVPWHQYQCPKLPPTRELDRCSASRNQGHGRLWFRSVGNSWRPCVRWVVGISSYVLWYCGRIIEWLGWSLEEESNWRDWCHCLGNW